MADLSSPDGDPTVRTLLRRVLDTADSRTPRRRRSTQTNVQRRLSQTPYSNRQGSQTKTSARKHSHGARSVARSARVQDRGHLEKQTPRTLLKNILLTAPESSTVMPDPGVKPAQVPEVARSSRRKSSRGSLELHLPELEPPSTLAPGLIAPGKRKQKLRLSVFLQEVNQGSPLSQEPCGNADVSTLASSFSFSFVTPGQPQTVERPGLARRRPIRRRLGNVGTLLQDLEDVPLASALAGDSPRAPVAALPMDVVLEDTQPFSQPLAGSSLPVNHSLPNPSHPGVEDAERVVGPGTPSTGTRLQKQTSQELSSSTHDLLPAAQPHELCEPPPSPPVAVLSSEPLESMRAKPPSRTRTAGPRHRQGPYKTGLSHYMKLFSFYTKMPVEKAALEIVEKCLDKYFQHLCNDLEVFAAHAGRKTVKPKDLELLMRRQGLVTDQVPMHVLVERYLPLEYRQQLVPCAFSGNYVFPAQ
ncbi:centromere protein T isoform X2 [Mastomys coucha]|uniref:centromere protein T isoform X2 n=1 Tax=Mastomys coucha TaxID=35658 RepID=UPI0012627D21|nr:centromere protein T isoform X2 [Mastomys coucha]